MTAAMPLRGYLCTGCHDLRDVVNDDGNLTRCPRCCCAECGEELVKDECPKGCDAPEVFNG